MIANLKKSSPASPVKNPPTEAQVREFLKEIQSLPKCAKSFLRKMEK